jgi:elongation factor 3
MHALAGVTFVQSVQSPALGMVVPLLIRGLRSRLTATRRQSCVIIDNMSKLVDEPLDAYPFLPTLMPALKFAADAMSDPEARNVAERASDQLNRLNTLCEEAAKYTKKADSALVLASLTSKMPKNVAAKEEVALLYTANLCCTMMNMSKFDAAEWASEISKYLAVLVGTESAEKITEKVRLECKEMVKAIPPKSDDDDNLEELCNCKFTLAYGTKILLHNTVMRLKRGAKYGLLGGNDSGTQLSYAICTFYHSQTMTLRTTIIYL